MFPLAALQLVPASLILLIATGPSLTQAREIPWLFGSRSLQNSQNEALHREDRELASNSATQMLVGVRKMSGDEGEMFFPEYWSFEATRDPPSEFNMDKREPAEHSRMQLRAGESSAGSANASIPQPLQAPFALHMNKPFENTPLLRRLLNSPRAIFALEQRDYKCPGDTTVCSSIGHPNSCCPAGTTCQSITDSGNGAVGCCPSGQTCGQQIGNCQAPDTSCPGSLGGGCCAPGYTCTGVGCLANSTVTITVEPAVTLPQTSTTPTSSAAAPSASTIINTSTFIATDSVIATVKTGSSARDPPSITPSSTAPPSSTSSTTPTPTTSTSSTTALLPPLRATSSTPLTITASQCPTGFYQCSAYLNAGCCQVGRDCALTSCPAASPITTLNSLGVTVLVPSGTQPALGVSGCALGWFNCGNDGGGGCCPSGYTCGTSCTATAVVVGNGATGTAVVAKDNKGGKVGVGMGVWSAQFLFIVGMLTFVF